MIFRFELALTANSYLLLFAFGASLVIVPLIGIVVIGLTLSEV